jgi:hypothetical protein
MTPALYGAVNGALIASAALMLIGWVSFASPGALWRNGYVRLAVVLAASAGAFFNAPYPLLISP